MTVLSWAALVLLIGAVALMLLDRYYALRWRHHRRVIEDINEQEERGGDG